MVEAQLNIYHHFCSQNSGMGTKPAGGACAAVRSNLYKGQDSGTHAHCLPSALWEQWLPTGGKPGRAHTEWGEATDVGRLGPDPASIT